MKLTDLFDSEEWFIEEIEPTPFRTIYIYYGYMSHRRGYNYGYRRYNLEKERFPPGYLNQFELFISDQDDINGYWLYKTKIHTNSRNILEIINILRISISDNKRDQSWEIGDKFVSTNNIEYIISHDINNKFNNYEIELNVDNLTIETKKTNIFSFLYNKITTKSNKNLNNVNVNFFNKSRNIGIFLEYVYYVRNYKSNINYNNINIYNTIIMKCKNRNIKNLIGKHSPTLYDMVEF